MHQLRTPAWRRASQDSAGQTGWPSAWPDRRARTSKIGDKEGSPATGYWSVDKATSCRARVSRNLVNGGCYHSPLTTRGASFQLAYPSDKLENSPPSHHSPSMIQAAMLLFLFKPPGVDTPGSPKGTAPKVLWKGSGKMGVLVVSPYGRVIRWVRG